MNNPQILKLNIDLNKITYISNRTSI